MQTATLKLKRTINAPAEEAYRAFTKAMTLREWLCDFAQVEPRKGGRFYVAWNDGEYASGEYTALEPGKRVAFTWLGKRDPAAGQVKVTLALTGDGTLVTVVHSGIASGG